MKAIGVARIDQCFLMPVETLVQHTREICSTPESIRKYAEGQGCQKPLSSLWVYVLKDVKAIEPVAYSYSGGSWGFAEIKKKKSEESAN